jgi:hypothetical protein
VVVLRDRQPQQPLGQAESGGQDDALRGALQDVLLRCAQRRRREQDDDEEEYRREDRPPVTDRVDDPRDEQRLGQRCRSADERQSGGQDQRTPMRPQQGQELAQSGARWCRRPVVPGQRSDRFSSRRRGRRPAR